MRSSMGCARRNSRRFAETSYAFEEKQRKWVSIADPQNDIEEFIISQAAAMASKVGRVQLADAENAESQVENAEAIELGEIHDIGCCLFFDPCGPTAATESRAITGGKSEHPGEGKRLTRMIPRSLWMFCTRALPDAAGCGSGGRSWPLI